jgi:tripartite-type tricarboxylate transporter receptor subunit TctC
MKALLIILLALSSHAAFAQTGGGYPNKPIRIIVGFPPGQATDIVARLLAQKFTDAWGQQMVVDNRPGKGGSIGAALGAKAPPDGYTLILSATAPLATNPNVYTNVGYDPLRDFAPISLVAWLPFILVTNPQTPARNLAEFITLAKAKPGQLNFGSSGNGSTSQLSMELMKTMAGINLVHVPYKGVVAAMTDLIAGQLQAMWDTALFLTPHIKGGKVIALAVSSPKRLAAFPEVPAAAETIPGYESGAWLGLVAPAGTPAAIIAKLNAETIRILRTPDVNERINALASEVLVSTPGEFGEHIARELAKWGKVVKDTGVRAE